jgi:hypothetical protein
MSKDRVSELRPPTGLLFVLQMIHGGEEPGGIILTEELGEKPVQCHFLHHGSHMD